MVKKYLLDRTKLERGDIILTAGNALVSKGIRVATLSRYSHAAIWVGGTMIEATLKGVFSKNAQRLLVDSPEHLSVFRSRALLSEETKDNICEYAQSKVGSLYALPDALMMLPKRILNLKASNASQFCSRLVACSYQHAGVDLVNIRNPMFCSPRQLSLCKALYKVEDVVSEALPAEIRFAQTPDPNTKNLIDTYEWLDKVRKLVNKDPILSLSFEIQAQNDVTKLLLAHPELDSEITNLIRNTGYLTFFNHDRHSNPYRYDPQLMTITLRGLSFDAGDFLQNELRKEPGLFTRYERNIQIAIYHIGLVRLNYFLDDLRLYRNLMNEILARLEVIAFGFNLIGEPESGRGVLKLAELAHYYVCLADKLLES